MHRMVHLAEQGALPARMPERNGETEPPQALPNTALMNARETMEVAFVADKPDDWRLHCHVAEHQAAGTMGRFRVCS